MGKVYKVSETHYTGWAVIEGDYGAKSMIHALIDGNVVASVLANQDPPKTHDSHLGSHWFSIVLDNSSSKRVAFCVAETQDVLLSTEETERPSVESIVESMPRRKDRRVKTYRDALIGGFTSEDIIELFYLDLLGRIPDREGLSSHSQAIQSNQASYDDVRAAFINSSEYKDRLNNIKSLPGRIFSMDIVYLSSPIRRRVESAALLALNKHDGIRETLFKIFPLLLPYREIILKKIVFAESLCPNALIIAIALQYVDIQSFAMLDSDRRTFWNDKIELYVEEYRDQCEYVYGAESTIFANGWHAPEVSSGSVARWMSDYGVINNLYPCDFIDFISIKILAFYGCEPSSIAVFIDEERQLQSNISYENDGGLGGVLYINRQLNGDLSGVVPGAPFQCKSITLIASHARSPLTTDEAFDFRLLSVYVASVEFAYVSLE